MRIAGIDGGNNTIIISTEEHNGKNAVIVPTVYVPYKDYNLGVGNKKEDLLNSLDVEITTYAGNDEKEKHLGRFLVGKYALETEKEKVFTREINKVKANDEGLFICILTTLAYTTVIEQKKFDGKVIAEYKIVSGLPIVHFKNHKEEFKNQFIGKHIVKFNNGAEVELRIVDAYIDCEGVGALNNELFDNMGHCKYSDEEIIDKIALGVDIGEFTFENIALEFNEYDGIVKPKYFMKLCGGQNLGIATAKQPVITEADKHGIIIDRYKVDTLVKRITKKGILPLGEGKELDIKPIYDEELKALALKIATYVNDKVTDANATGRIKEVFLFGGAPEVLERKFESYITNDLSKMLKCKVSTSENSLTANADGYYKKAINIYCED